MTNPFLRLETFCANAVERAFAIAFPSALEPVQIARKLVGAFEAAATPAGRAGRCFTVRLHPSDYARFAPDLPYLERQWATMLANLAERSGCPQRPPQVRTQMDPTLTSGTVAIATSARSQPERLMLRVRKGVPPNACLALAGELVIGRDPSCSLALADPRASRRHLRIATKGTTPRFVDLGSSNGTLLNGRRVAGGTLDCGDVLRVGDSELVIEADTARGASA